MSEENKLPEPIRTGKVGRPAIPVMGPEDQKKIDGHRSRGIVKNRRPVGALKLAKVKKILKLKGTPVGTLKTMNRDKKIALFVDAFIANGGNASQAVKNSFGITSSLQASQIGHQLLKEVKGMANIYLESKGNSYGKLLDTAVEKMKESKSPEWWDRIMKMAGHEDFISKEKSAPVSVNIIGGQKDFLKGYIEEGEILPNED